MRKLYIAMGFLTAALLAGGISFLVSAQAHAEPEIKLGSEEEPTVAYLLAQAELGRSQRRVSDAVDYARRAIKLSSTPKERAEAGHQMGVLMMEDWRDGGTSESAAAILYLRAAVNASDDSLQRTEIGMDLLDALQEVSDMDMYEALLDEMLLLADTPSEMTTLWKRKLLYLIDLDAGWKEMDEALTRAQSLAVESVKWDEMLQDMELRMKEKVLTDSRWFEAYASTRSPEERADCRQKLFIEVSSELERLFEDMDLKNRALVRIRLAAAHVAMRHIDEAYTLLMLFVDMEPRDNLNEAFGLLTAIAGMSGNPESVIPMAQSLINSKGINKLDQKEILDIVGHLKALGLLDEALRVVVDRLSEVDLAIGKRVELLVQATVLEECIGNRARALEYMNQLASAEASREVGDALSQIIKVDMDRGEYDAVEFWVERFLSLIPPNSENRAAALFALFEAKYWLARSVSEQLYVGAVAVQTSSDDSRTPQVELSMAQTIENLGLYDLAITYYNRIGLLHLFTGDYLIEAASENEDEQAVLGKVRCLMELEDWVAVDRLCRDLCRRTRSPLVKSGAAVRWAELALRDGQHIEAQRRYDLAHVQMLSKSEQVRYMLGNLKLQGNEQLLDENVIRSSLETLSELPEEERRRATVTFFDNTYEFLMENEGEQAVLQLIDLAYQSPYKDWMPLENYVLRVCSDRAQADEVASLGNELHQMGNVVNTSLDDLLQMIDRFGELGNLIK
ncbi:MAG: hypothetical protein JXR23_07335 [Pontiellaceae bacterium]|nr:hypothetical protein [Pontiellaceae bacterium]